MQEGAALGLMVLFPELVISIEKASIDNSVQWNDRFSTLYHLQSDTNLMLLLHAHGSPCS